MRRDAEVLLVNGIFDSMAIRVFPVGDSQDSKLEVVVPFTDASGTLAAMSVATQLAQGLDARTCWRYRQCRTSWS